MHELVIRDKCFHPSGAFVPFTRDEIEQSIAARFEKQVARYGRHLAVKTKSQELSYDQLNRFANRVAHGILQQLGDGEEPVALLLEQGASLIATILGALKAGKMYVPLDPSYPRSRISYAIRDSQARLIVTNRANADLAEALAEHEQHILNLEELDGGFSADSPGVPVPPNRAAFLLYTSGSTGQPKGVVHNHRNLLHEIMNYTNGLHICAADRIVLLSSCSFVDSVRATYGALLNGAALYPYHIKEEGLPGLVTLLIEQEITISRFVPTVFRHFCSVLSGEENFPNLRLINLSGEPVDRRDVELYSRHLAPHCVLVNSLGSTETMTFRWNFISKDDPIAGNNVPVGYAVQDMEVLLLNDAGNEVGFNRIAEIAVKSRYLSPGYWRSPELTRSKFLGDPSGSDERIYLTGDLGSLSPDGCLVHQGRKDFQVKIRGFRIELGEVEAILRRHPDVRQAAALIKEETRGDERLVAYVVPEDGATPVSSDLQHYLQEKLPHYMVPAAFVTLKALPLTPNGKVNRQAFPEPDWSSHELEQVYVAPRTPVEEVLASIYIEVLNVEKIGIHDSFFELGGHSLSAMQAMSRLQDALHVQLPITTIVERPTIASLAEAVEQARAAVDDRQPSSIPRASWELRRVWVSSSGTLALHEDPIKETS